MRRSKDKDYAFYLNDQLSALLKYNSYKQKGNCSANTIMIDYLQEIFESTLSIDHE